MAQYEIPAPITINGVATDFEVVKKGLEKVTMNTVKSIPDWIGMIYKPGDFTAYTMKKKVLSGLTDAGAWDGVDEIPTEGLEFLYDLTATHAFYAKGTEITLPMATFDIYNIMDAVPRELGIALGWKRQKVALAPLTTGFTTEFADGVYFFSASHPNDARYTTATTQSNLVSGALSVSTLASAINAMVAFTDPLGRPRRRIPRRLWVAAGKGMQARTYLNVGMNMESGTANNNRNPFREFPIEVVECNIINETSTTMWFLQADDSAAYKSTRIPVKTMTRQQDNHAIKHEGIFCDAYWFEDWTGWVGSLGV